MRQNRGALSWLATGAAMLMLATVFVGGAQGTVGAESVPDDSAVEQSAERARPSNDMLARSRLHTGPRWTHFGNNYGATLQRCERALSHGRRGGASVWFRWRSGRTQRVIIDTPPGRTNFDTVLGVYRGRGMCRFTRIAGNDDAPGYGLQSRVQFRAIRGRMYYIAVDGYRGDMGRYGLRIRRA